MTTSDQVVANAVPVTSPFPVMTAALGDIPAPPAPGTIVTATPAVVEQGQATVLGTASPVQGGDTLVVTQSAGSGVVSLGVVQPDGTQQVIYTAPAHVAASGTDAVEYVVTDTTRNSTASGSQVVTLDAGPTIVAATPVVVEHRQTTVLGTVSPGQGGDILTLTQAAGALGTVSLGTVQDDGTQKVIYTASSSIATSGTDSVAYSITDQHNDVAAAGNASVTLDAGPAISPVSPVAVEQGQTTVVGTVSPGLSTDTLTLDQASGALGTVSLGAEQPDGTQTVIYTAPAHVADSGTDAISYSVTDQHGGIIASNTASVALDAGPAIVAAVPAAVEHGQTTLLGTVSPGAAGDVLTLVQAAGALGTVSLGAVQPDGTQQVTYTAPASIAASGTDAVRYSITDQHNDTVAGNAVSVTLDAGPALVAATPVVVEQDQTTVLGTVSPGERGDTLTLTQAAGALGTVSLGAVQDDGTRQVIYTAPASVAANGTDTVSYSVIDQIGVVTTGATASVTLDVGPSVIASIPAVLEEHQTTVIGTASPGQSGDTLSITQVAGALGTVSLGAVQPDGTQQVIYTAPGDLAASATDAISYSVVDQHDGAVAGGQHDGAVASGTASVVLDAGPTIVAADPATVEERQTTVLGTVSPGAIGDVLTLTQAPGALGTVSLGTVQADGTQQIIYAAPNDVVASDTDTVKYSITDQHDGLVVSRTVPVILDSGPTITAGEPASVEQGQTTVLGTVSPGINGDTLILQKTSDALGTIELGTVRPDGTREVIYTAPDKVTASVTDKVSYKVTDQLGSVVKSTTMSVDLDAGPAIAAATPTVVGSGQSTILGTASRGTSGDTLTLTQASGALGTVSLGALQADGTQQVIYAAPANVPSSGTDTVSYSVTDQHGAVVASSTAAVTLMMAAFANLTVAQGSPVLPITVDVAMLPALAGHFSNLGGGALSADGGTYSVTGTAAQVNAALHGVGFTSTQAGMVVPALQVTLAGGPGTLFDAGRGDHVTGNGSKLAVVANGTATLLTASSSGGETLVAGAGGDTLDGAAASSGDVFFGSAGGTVFVGGAGRDTMVGGGGSNTVTSGSGGSVIFLGSGQNLLQSHGADTLIGGGGSDTIQAGAAALVAFAGSGSTSFTGGTASSTVIGGSGSLTVSGGAGGGLFYGGTGGNNLLQSGGGAASMVAGGNGDQLVATGSGRHVLVAGIGNETLKAAGSAGNDVVFGGSGADAVSLGSGSTIFLAGSGSASISAGSGTDLFDFVSGRVGPVTISGFDAAHDRLALFGYGQNEVANAVHGANVTGGSTVLSLSDGTHITLLGVTGLTAGSIV